MIETRDKDKTWIFLEAFTVRTLIFDWTIQPKREKGRKHVLPALVEVKRAARGAKPRDAEEKEELAVISYKFSFRLRPDEAE